MVQLSIKYQVCFSFYYLNIGIKKTGFIFPSIENMPIEMILQQLGINSNTLQPSNTMSNYYRSNFFNLNIKTLMNTHV